MKVASQHWTDWTDWTDWLTKTYLRMGWDGWVILYTVTPRASLQSDASFWKYGYGYSKKI